MSAQIAGDTGVLVEVDEAKNLQVFQTHPGYPSAGGWYSVAGRSGTAAIAAALATDTSLMSARLSVSSTRRAYIMRMRVNMGTLTAGAAGGVPSILGLQRFNGATPSGGVQRTAARFALSKGSASDITDIRDNNAALTMTSVAFLDEIAWTLTPTNGAGVSNYDWIMEPDAPIELAPGEGLCLRTRQVGPATATWFFTYSMYWYER